MAAAPEGGGKPKAASRLASPSFWAKLSLLSVALAVLSSYAYSHPSTQLFFMRFFRDVARARAHARLHGNAYALQVLMGEDEVLLSAATASRPFGNPDSGLGPVTEYAPDTGVTFTADELARFDGTDGAPLYLAVRGRVYDVSARPGFYGPGRSYHCLTAKDATRALATGCKRPKCLVASVVGLTEKEKREVDRWVDFFERHDKYHFVGKMVPDPVADMIQRKLLEERVAKRVANDILGEEGQLLSPLGQAARVDAVAQAELGQGQLDEALALWSAALAMLEEVDEESERAAAAALSRRLRLARASGWQKQKRYSKAEADYSAIIEELSSSTAPQDQWTVAQALANKAVVKDSQGLIEEALAPLADALERFQALAAHKAQFPQQELEKQRDAEANALYGALSLQTRTPACQSAEGEASCRTRHAMWTERLQDLCRGNHAAPSCQRLLEDLTAIELLAAARQQ